MEAVPESRAKMRVLLDPGIIPRCKLLAVKSHIRRIGEVALAAGVSPDTLRYYERMGLLPKVSRSQSGYREYSPEAVDQVRFVRNAMRFGFALQDVAKFLRNRERGNPPCREVRAAAENILLRVDRQIKELQTARRTIRATLKDWDLRLRATPADRPAFLLQTLKTDHIATDGVRLPLRRSKN